MTNFQEEKSETCKTEISLLIDEAWDEIGHGQRKGRKPDPDYEKYNILEKSDSLKILTVRDEGTLVGYCILIIAPSLHFKGERDAHINSLFLKKDYRHKGVGSEFISYIESVAFPMVGKNINWGVTMENDWSSILERRGYFLLTKTYGR